MNTKQALAIGAALAVSALSHATDTPSADAPHLWIISDLSYEMASSSLMSYEFGFGWYGVGGGVNLYTDPTKTGLMYSARAGLWGGGVALNAGVNYVGSFSDTVKWRVGFGAEYLQGSGIFSDVNGIVPIIEASIGIKL
jgi:hypothetical protein